MKAFLTLVLATAVLALSAQNDLNRELVAFTSVAVNYGLDVTVVKADRYALTVTGDAAALSELKIENKPGIFGITFEDNANQRLSSSQLKSVKVTVYTKTLEHVVANGGAEVRSADTWQADKFKVVINGGAELTLVVDTDNLDLLANGGSEINCSGNAKVLKITANGGAEVNAADLRADDAQVMANGGSGVRVQADQSLKVTANGNADITYAGKATKLDVRSNGGSSITRL